MTGWARTAIAIVLVLQLTPTGLANSTAIVNLEYTLGSTFDGVLDARCGAPAAIVSVGRMDFRAASARWVRHHVEQQRLFSDQPHGGQSVPLGASLEVTEGSFEAGEGWVDVSAGRFVALPMQRGEEIRADFDAERLHLDRMVPGVTTHYFFKQKELTLDQEWAGFVAPARSVVFERGNATLYGSVQLFLENATVGNQDGPVFALPPRRQNQTEAGHGFARLETSSENYAFLFLEGAELRISAKSAAQVFCSELAATIRGKAAVYGAQGNLSTGDKEFSFRENALSIDGDLEWNEEPTASGVRANAHGLVRSASVDFVPIGAAGVSDLAKTGLAMALAAVVLAFAYKSFLFFFSRLDESQVVGHPSRALILETVKGNPNVNLQSLVASTKLPKPIVRYHTRLLVARGLLRSHRVHNARCFVAKDTIAQVGRQVLQGPHLMERYDPVLAALLAIAPMEERRMNDVLLELASRAQISRVGAWKAVKRAEKQGLLLVRKESGGAWVRKASPA